MDRKRPQKTLPQNQYRGPGRRMYHTPRVPEALVGLLPDIPSASSDMNTSRTGLRGLMQILSSGEPRIRLEIRFHQRK